MKIQRTKNAARNIVYDGFLRLYNMLVPFVMRSIILHYLGVEYLGLSGLFSSILSFLNLAELGVGTAMVFSMYKPIAEDDTDSICALMGLYRKFYRIIGLFIAVVGLALTPFLRNLVHGDVPPDVNLYILYFMNLASTVLTYWLFAYKNCLLHAHQRTDIGSKLALVINTVQNLLKILVLVVFHNYYLYLLIQLLSQVATNIFTAVIVTKKYPNYHPRGDLPREKIRDITRRVRDLFTAKLAYVIFESADTLVISSFLGLTPLAIYQNYFYIVNSLRRILTTVASAFVAGVGNSLLTETVEKNFKDMRKLTLMYNWLVGICACMLLCMYQPFIELWVGADYLLPTSCMMCFVVYLYTLEINRPMHVYKDAAGIWHKDRFRPLVASLVNLGLNISTVQWLGLYGVILSSVVAVIIVEVPWLLHNIFREVFPRKMLSTFLLDLLGFLFATSASCAASWLVCKAYAFFPFVTLLLNAAVSFIVPNVIYLLCFGRGQLFAESKIQVKNLQVKKLKRRSA